MNQSFLNFYREFFQLDFESLSQILKFTYWYFTNPKIPQKIIELFFYFLIDSKYDRNFNLKFTK